MEKTRRKTKKKRDYKCHGVILIVLEITFCLSTVVMAIMEFTPGHINCDFIVSEYAFIEEFFIEERSHIMDGFCLLWGMSITVVLFLIESGNTYWYGLRFKRIIRAMLYKHALILGAVEYILLCPVTYIMEVKERYKTCLWCIILTFLVFTAIPFYTIHITRKKTINSLILRESARELQNVIDMKKNSYTQMKIQQLLVSSMIVNTIYEDSQEVEQLVVIMQGMFRDKKIDVIICNTIFNHVTVMTWVEQIIEQSGFHTEQERERTIYILKRLWEVIKEEIQSEELDEETQRYKLLSYAVEILLPVFYREEEITNRIFFSVWANMKEVYFKVLPYLFLYAEFCYKDCQQEFFEKYYHIIFDIKADREKIKAECRLWKKGVDHKERQIAREFWIAWAFYRDGSNNIGLTAFNKFCDDVEMISQDNIAALRTYTMKKVRNILR